MKKLFQKKKSLFNTLLPPCPFCGGEPQLTRCGDQKQFLVYICSVCKVTPVDSGEARITANGAAKIWEIRVRDARRILSADRYVSSKNEKHTDPNQMLEQLLEDFKLVLHYAGKNNNVCSFCKHDGGEGENCKGRENHFDCTPEWRGLVEDKNNDGE